VGAGDAAAVSRGGNEGRLKFAYADPPYLGCGQTRYGHLHADAVLYDTLEGHRQLIDRLCRDYDGWAMSLSTPSLRKLLPICPDDCRVGAWVKPFCAFKPNVNPPYAWEPVIYRGARKRTRKAATVRDFVSANITLKRGLTGAKPEEFCWWVLDLLGVQQDDQFDDIFPGSGAMTRAAADYFMRLIPQDSP
jgi:hypothetical protein